MSNLLARVPVLKGDNYLEWADALKAYLMSQNLWTAVNDLKPPTLYLPRALKLKQLALLNKMSSKEKKNRSWVQSISCATLAHGYISPANRQLVDTGLC
jgi:hypothetical protein